MAVAAPTIERQRPILLALEAHHAERNHHRAYEIEVGQDLLCEWTVTVRYGRTRVPGRALTYWMPDLEAARAFVRRRLKRRLTAPRRIACRYQITQASLTSGETLENWVPEELLTTIEHS